MFIHFVQLYLNLFISMSFPRRWWGKLFHSLIILTKKECLKALTLADFNRILNGLLDLVLSLQYSKQSRHSTCLTQILSYSTLLKRNILFDAQACSSLVIRISLHMTSHVVFAQGQLLRLFVVSFQWLVRLWQGRVTIPGLHILIEVLQVTYNK